MNDEPLALPPGWCTAHLEAISQVRLGRQRSPQNHEGPNMRPYLRAANLTWLGVDVSDVKKMNFTDNETATYRLADGDILLSEASGSAKEVGKPGVWRNQLPGDMCFQNTLLRVRPEDGINSDYLYYRLLHECLRGGFSEASRGVGIHHLGAAGLANLVIEVPPTAEQQRIAKALSERLSLVDLAQADLSALACRVRALTDASLNSVVRSALSTVDAVTPVGEVADISGGIQKQPKRYPTEGNKGVPFLRVANVGRRVLDLEDVHRILITEKEALRVLLTVGDLLVVEGNGSAAQIGRASLWQGVIDPCTHQNHLIRVRAKACLLPEYLELVWNAPSTASQIKNVAITTTGLYTLSTKKVAAVCIPVPSLEAQRELVARATGELALVAHTVQQLEVVARHLAALRRSIINAAFAGRLLPQDQTDGHADLILKRIAEDRQALAATARAAKKGTVRKAPTHSTQEPAT